MFPLFMLGSCKWDVTSYFIRHSESMHVKSSRCSLQQSEAEPARERNSEVLCSQITATTSGNDRSANLNNTAPSQGQTAAFGEK